MSVLREIAALVAERHGVTVADLKSASHARKFAWPRQEAMALTLATGRFSTTRVGQFYNRDHTTVIHARRAYEARVQAARE